MSAATLTTTRTGISRSHPRRRRAVTDRLRLVVETLEGAPCPGGVALEDLLRRFEACLGVKDDSRTWLALAVLAGELPDADAVVRARRAIALDGVLSAFAHLLVPSGTSRWSAGDAAAVVEVVTGTVIVDVEHTARTHLATGIQRVTREVIKRWHRDHDVVLTGWSPHFRCLRRLLPAEQERALTGRTETTATTTGPAALVVPWRCTYVLPELAPERERNARIGALVRFSGSRSGVIGYDCIPITSAETTDANVSEAFTGYLAAVRSMDLVVPISRASATEFRGWSHMLSAIGLPGPVVEEVLLPAEVGEVQRAVLERTRRRLVVGRLPVVLCVGTHEPRKNHLAVLEAARMLWEEGHKFSLAFIGGHAWSSEAFQQRVRTLQRQDHPVETLTSVTDQELWAAYQIAHCVVFPSLNEGFGLPVAEALATGTPAVTSAFGSMEELAEGGGALLVDPHDDAAIAAAIGTLLGQPEVYARLRAEAAARSPRRWDDYAEDVWRLMLAGQAPVRTA